MNLHFPVVESHGLLSLTLLICCLIFPNSICLVFQSRGWENSARDGMRKPYAILHNDSCGSVIYNSLCLHMIFIS